MIALQLMTLRRPVGRIVVAVCYLLFLGPYVWLALPSYHIESTAASVGSAILEDIKSGSLDSAAAYFQDSKLRGGFLAKVEQYGLPHFRSWVFVGSRQICGDQGCSDFRVTLGDGSTLGVEFEVWTQYFGSPLATFMDIETG
jgi:hypothetical protein